MNSGELLTTILTITTPLVVAGGVLWRLASKVSRLESSSAEAGREAHAAGEKAAEAHKAVGDLRQEIARDYVRSGPFEARMQRLEERIDDLPGRIVSLMSPPPPASRTRRRRTDDAA